MTVLENLLDSGVCAVMRKLPVADVEAIATALVDGGVKGLEVTLDSEDALFIIKQLSEKFGDTAIVGAGTVLNAEQAEAAIEAGAKFIFAPILDKETIEVAKSHGVIAIPGVFTPTEAHHAMKWGADVVKVFPAECVGPSFIKSVSGPLSHVKMMPTGGVNLDTIDSFIKAGAVAVGAGGSLLNADLIAAKDWQGLRQLASEFVGKVQESRGNSKVLK
ncbi:bifunctional 4-hydroxy-2-oxoglutarate aldolase/2-dehydro-3-deoxy-phosphogluconate aldolase [Alkalihalobacillus sp. 1P02AB]|uniref:bifunctional 4-hydroxy-2-oxoglutarate aldolase/2-dehydro-3-deoxy-phosphogluconate aldolase n=1 Tax=Alkalihalobacillus sp. 1P02AB TaxID=3132260 RepID=UPI0039A44EF8